MVDVAFSFSSQSQTGCFPLCLFFDRLGWWFEIPRISLINHASQNMFETSWNIVIYSPHCFDPSLLETWHLFWVLNKYKPSTPRYCLEKNDSPIWNCMLFFCPEKHESFRRFREVGAFLSGLRRFSFPCSYVGAWDCWCWLLIKIEARSTCERCVWEMIWWCLSNNLHS